MWGSRERVESKITPRLKAWGDGETMVPSMVRVGLLALLRVDLEPMRRNSVLLLFSLRKLFCIQVLIANRQELMWEREGLWGDLVLR